ncbi:Charged multivesicular body protein 3 [Galemys pyrenaicus]|uniref:Charged multivesicular body protein 3 n=1 Tax=Galemys pyrenaicus TaxID=202257 RepID=A0A8J6AK47_GALPY|nr:Charged multivesicular body protein 3 [Galemys pyrenaicus]
MVHKPTPKTCVPASKHQKSARRNLRMDFAHAHRSCRGRSLLRASSLFSLVGPAQAAARDLPRRRERKAGRGKTSQFAMGLFGKTQEKPPKELVRAAVAITFQGGHAQVGAPVLNTGINGRRHEDARTVRINQQRELRGPTELRTDSSSSSRERRSNRKGEMRWGLGGLPTSQHPGTNACHVSGYLGGVLHRGLQDSPSLTRLPRTIPNLAPVPSSCRYTDISPIGSVENEGSSVIHLETYIQREEEKVKRSVKDAAKKGQKDVCVVLAKEMIRSRKAVSKLYASKAHMNSVLMGMKNQLAVLRVAGSLQKSTEVMKAMQSLVKIPEIQATMRELSKEMMKAGIIEEMLEDTFESMDDQEEMEEAAEMEIDKILFEITAGALGKAPSKVTDALPEPEPPGAMAAEEEEEEEEALEAMQSRLATLRS